jgi:hypothetical protein
MDAYRTRAAEGTPGTNEARILNWFAFIEHNSTRRKLHFADAGTHCRVRTQEVLEGAPVKTDVGWTERMRHDKTASPQTEHFNSVRLHACSTLAGLERFQADLCRALGRVHPRPSTLLDVLL